VACTPEQVFQHHAEALGAEDIDAIVSDYADDALFITPEGVLRGKDGVREAFEKLTSDVRGAEWELPTQIYEDDILCSSGRRRPRTRKWTTGSTRLSSATA
jgi:ketosteroid isomerase-like protein